jgi:small subunit ribosomal protein S20
MPIKKAAFKALRQSRKRQARNKAQKDEIKNLIKSVKKAIAKNNKEEALKLLKDGYKKIDKAAKRGLIHKNTAARKKSRLMKKLNNIKK